MLELHTRDNDGSIPRNALTYKTPVKFVSTWQDENDVSLANGDVGVSTPEAETKIDLGE